MYNRAAPKKVVRLAGLDINNTKNGICCSKNHTVVCTTKGDVYTWGIGTGTLSSLSLSLSFYFPCSYSLHIGGRLGYGDETHYLAPVMLSLNKVIVVACSISHSGFITSEGRILSTSPLPPSHSIFFESLKVYICVGRMNSGN